MRPMRSGWPSLGSFNPGESEAERVGRKFPPIPRCSIPALTLFDFSIYAPSRPKGGKMGKMRVHTLWVTLCAVGIVLAMSCSDSQTSPDTGELKITILGVVTDFETGAPIENASAQVCSGNAYMANIRVQHEARTDNEGRYTLTYITTLSKCGQADYWVRAEADGYGPSWWREACVVKCVTNIQTVDLQLESLPD